MKVKVNKKAWKPSEKDFLSKDSSIEKIIEDCKKYTDSLYCKEGNFNYLKSKDFYTQYGFHYEECWELSTIIAYFILPRLIHFRNITVSVPGCFLKDYKGQDFNEKEAEKRWKKILSFMIEAFYRIIYVDNLLIDKNERKINNYFINKGLKLFTKYYNILWS